MDCLIQDWNYLNDFHTDSEHDIKSLEQLTIPLMTTQWKPSRQGDKPVAAITADTSVEQWAVCDCPFKCELMFFAYQRNSVSFISPLSLRGPHTTCYVFPFIFMTLGWHSSTSSETHFSSVLHLKATWPLWAAIVLLLIFLPSSKNED